MTRLQVKDNIAILNTTYLDNKFIDDEYKSVLEKLKDEDEYFYKVYALGEWASPNITGLCYKKFTNYNIIQHEYIKELPIIVACDFNYDPMAWVLIQNVKGVDYVFDEIYKQDTDTEETVQELLSKYGHVKYKIYGDYSGTFRSSKTLSTDYSIIQSYLPRAEVITKPNPPIIQRVKAVNWRLCSKNTTRRLFIDPKCKYLIRDFQKVKFKDNSKEIDKSNPELTHISDALGYYIEYEYSLKGKPNYSNWQGL